MVVCSIVHQEYQVTKKFHWIFKKNREKNPEYQKSYEKKCEDFGKMMKNKYEDGELEVWNKNLTKKDHPSLQKFSERMSGDKNIIHQIKKDPIKFDNFKKTLSKSLKETPKSRKNKTYDDIFGIEKSTQYKQSLSKAVETRKFHGHTGKFHTEKTKEILRQKTSKRISEGKFNVYTIPMQKFYNILKELHLETFFEKEYFFDFYSIDFASPKLKLAVEIDGDFWHCNPKVYPNGPKYASQIRNLKIQKRKENYIKKKNWKILRFWEYDINNNPNKIKKIVLKNLNVETER
jgi:very-short-patch-repair endonuclease